MVALTDLTGLMARAAECVRHPSAIDPTTPIRVGVDLGTAYTVIMITGSDGEPLAGVRQFADTGIAIVHDGEVVETFDQATGGVHLSLVISGAMRLPFSEAERLKTDGSRHAELSGMVRPVLEKISTIVRDRVAGRGVEQIHLIGGTSAFTGIAEVMTRITGLPSRVVPEPMLVTPLGVAGWSRPRTQEQEEVTEPR